MTVGESEAVSLDGVGFFWAEKNVAVLGHPDLTEGDAVVAHEVVVRQLRGHCEVAGRRLGLLVAVRFERTLPRRTRRKGKERRERRRERKERIAWVKNGEWTSG